MFIIIIHEGRWISTYTHIKLIYIYIYIKRELNVGTKVYNKLPGYIKEIDSYKACKKGLKLFLLLHNLLLSGRICIFVIMYRGADKSSAQPSSRCILFDGENISFDASLIYINSTNIPPIMIINRLYENTKSSVAVACSFLVRLRTYQHSCNLYYKSLKRLGIQYL